MKTESHKNRAVPRTQEIQHLSSCDSTGTVFLTEVPVWNVNSLLTETVLYFTVINKRIYSLLTLAAAVP
jgi:hypothetical protein